LALKGGNIREEIQAMGKGFYSEIRPISKMFSEPYFEEKAVVYVQG
jgi:16S rRNA (guanine527-N7)-methyltransferase